VWLLVSLQSLLYKGKKIRAWGGPGKGTVEMDGSQWLPYQPATLPTPPFPDHTDAQGEGENSQYGEAGRLAQHAEAVAYVLPEVVPREPMAGFVEAFFGLHEVAEG
jgi:hypothetical protein